MSHQSGNIMYTVKCLHTVKKNKGVDNGGGGGGGGLVGG